MPLYSNPSGTIYSEQTVRRLAATPAAAADFRLLWDDAYRFHHSDRAGICHVEHDRCLRAAGHPDRALVFASLSKATLAGSGVAFLRRRRVTSTGGSARRRTPSGRTS